MRVAVKEKFEDLIISSLREPDSAVSYSVNRTLSVLYPDRVVVEGTSSSFDLLEYARGGHCKAEPGVATHSQIVTAWQGPSRGVSEAAGNAWYDVEWNGRKLSVLMLNWTEAFQPKQGVWILSETKETGVSFLEAVSEWCAETRGEIVVFEGGCWQKSKELYQSIQSATFDNLILPASVKQEIQNDFAHFFGARERYAQYGVPWKRGVLFHGPPGNGKTHTLKALINWLNQPCLYIKSFKAQRFESEHAMIRSVFNRARQTTPCLLVLEDLDSLIGDSNRSFFLNELDGFAANTGIVVLATTNHPERLDPAILDRPSRFDRKYEFGLPQSDERHAYLNLWNERSQPDLRLSEAGLALTVELTEGFSFAYLKELWLSSMMTWIDNPQPGSMDGIVTAQVRVLLEQMATPISEPAPATDDDDPMQRIMRSFAGR